MRFKEKALRPTYKLTVYLALLVLIIIPCIKKKSSMLLTNDQTTLSKTLMKKVFLTRYEAQLGMGRPDKKALRALSPNMVKCYFEPAQYMILCHTTVLLLIPQANIKKARLHFLKTLNRAWPMSALESSSCKACFKAEAQNGIQYTRHIKPSRSLAYHIRARRCCWQVYSFFAAVRMELVSQSVQNAREEPIYRPNSGRLHQWVWTMKSGKK